MAVASFFLFFLHPSEDSLMSAPSSAAVDSKQLTGSQALKADFVAGFLVFLIAMPLSYFAMDKWLQGYDYHTPISWWIFAASGIGILLVTLLTVSFQSLRAATMNPSKSLRTE